MGQIRMMVPGEGDKLVAEWDVKNAKSTGVSKETFDNMMAEEARLAYTSSDGANTAIAEFDEDADTIVIVPIGHGG